MAGLLMRMSETDVRIMEGVRNPVKPTSAQSVGACPQPNGFGLTPAAWNYREVRAIEQPRQTEFVMGLFGSGKSGKSGSKSGGSKTWHTKPEPRVDEQKRQVDRQWEYERAKKGDFVFPNPRDR
jgi:hypothetical protein